MAKRMYSKEEVEAMVIAVLEELGISWDEANNCIQITKVRLDSVLDYNGNAPTVGDYLGNTDGKTNWSNPNG